MPSRKSRPRAPIQVPAGVVTARGTREDRTMADETFCWFAGVDWGSAKHQVCLLDEAGKVVGERAFAHGGAGLAALCDWLERFQFRRNHTNERALRLKSSTG